MLEIYVSMILLGMGYFIKKKTEAANNENPNKNVQSNNVPSNNVPSNNVPSNNVPSNNVQSNNVQNNNVNKPSNIISDLSTKYLKKSFYQDTNSKMVEDTEKIKAEYLFNENSEKRSKEKHETVGNNYFGKQQSSLSGTFIDMNHSNMTPFFRGNVNNISEKSPLLEKFTGKSETIIKKGAVSPLFVPQQDNITGMKVNTDLYQGRIQKPIIMNNVTPIPQIRVGKGIGKGFTSEPSGGFQQFEERAYAMPKNIDELRAKNNPKESYKGVVLEGQKPVKRAKTPNLKKYKDDQFYENAPNRYFVTTGEEIKPAKKAEINIKYGSRPETSTEYKGAAYLNNKDGDHPEELAPYSTFRQNLKSSDVVNPKLTNRGKGGDYDHGKNSILIYSNERNMTTEKTYEGNVMSLVKAIVAPITDALKISKKEYTLESAREMGQLQTFIQKQTIQLDDVARTTIKETLLQESTNINLNGNNKTKMYDPNDIARTTIKETLLQESEYTNLNGNNKTKMYDPNDTAKTTIKETLLQESEYTNLNGNNKTTMYDPNDTAKTTIKETLLQESEILNIDAKRNAAIIRSDDIATSTIRETLQDIDNAINMKPGKNAPIVKDPNDVAKTTIKETTIDSDRDGVLFTSTDTRGAYNDVNFDIKDTHKQYLSQVEYTGNVHVADQDGYKIVPTDLKKTQKETLSDNDYIGGASDQIVKEPQSYEAIYNATMNEIKEELEKNRDPTQTSVKIAASSKEIGREVAKKNNIQYESYQTKTYINQPVYNKITDETLTRDREEYPNKRFNQSVVDSLTSIKRNNPYNIDLSSSMS